ncbi:EFCB7 protein, partial [Neodrepanis coruscans]|nr:EFCB7 protein [Neodrepanis coruscans]
QDWHWAQSKGCFYLEEDGEILSHKYRLHLPHKTPAWVTIKPLNIPQAEGESCPWLSVDTALFILKENESPEDLQLVGFTELQNQEVCGWKGELGAGIYWLLPFTTGCRLKKGTAAIPAEAKLLYRDEDGELALTRDFHKKKREKTQIYSFFPSENFEMKKNELTRQGFLDLNLMEATDSEGDPSDLWVTLLSLGYNKALEMTQACPFVMDVCAERCRPRVKAMSVEKGGSQLSRALCRAGLEKGEAKALPG